MLVLPDVLFPAHPPTMLLSIFVVQFPKEFRNLGVVVRQIFTLVLSHYRGLPGLPGILRHFCIPGPPGKDVSWIGLAGRFLNAL